MAAARPTRKPVQMKMKTGGLNALLNISPESSGIYYMNIDNGKAANSDDFGPSEEGTYTLSVTDVTGTQRIVPEGVRVTSSPASGDTYGDVSWRSRSLNLNRGYAVVDLEMTGTNPTDELIIEIGIGVKHPEHQDLSTDRTMVRIDRPLPARITQLTGITDRDLAYGGIPIDDALAWLVEKTQGLPLVGHDILRSDRPFLLAAARRHLEAVEQGLQPKAVIEEDRDLPPERFVDTAALYKGHRIGHYPIPGESHHEYSPRMQETRAWGIRTGLSAACEDLGISISRVRAHRAAGDVLQTHRLFEKLLELNPPE